MRHTKKLSKRGRKRDLRMRRLIESNEGGKILDLVEIAHSHYRNDQSKLLRDIKRLRSRGLIERDRTERNAYFFKKTEEDINN